MTLKEITTISALLDSPNSIGIIPAGNTTTNISNLYYQRPKKRFPYKVSKDKTGKTKVGYINPKNNSVKDVSTFNKQTKDLLGKILRSK